MESASNLMQYKECLRNHTVHMALYIVDGCQVFMNGRIDQLLCQGCGCHRNFHRKVEVDNHVNVNGRRHVSSSQVQSMPGAGQGSVTKHKMEQTDEN
ncbi:hypothetical protein AQUCO_05500122v1 [Aquilegia coerulea]|uniref:ZF-HD dimerization-type domain-containing protein n=1 Tax=Aquilegia coerulea TaxID=218851 RepID=A0A2G5CH53_AQUCA|nr:hypothetical protein AQUCO_05500122v1 [Aquilegia coerulea]